ncbi:hypothetical protein TNCV_3388061 [Trichonephila clavipes]|nr:hypothetical protein TNCV_3388061 [Trichonephila clavipes]
MSLSLVSLKTRPVGGRWVLNLSKLKRPPVGVELRPAKCPNTFLSDCIVPLCGTLNVRRAASPLVRLVEGKETPDQPQVVSPN